MAFKIKLAGIGFQVNGISDTKFNKSCGDYLDIEENSDNKKCFDTVSYTHLTLPTIA